METETTVTQLLVPYSAYKALRPASWLFFLPITIFHSRFMTQWSKLICLKLFFLTWLFTNSSMRQPLCAGKTSTIPWPFWALIPINSIRSHLPRAVCADAPGSNTVSGNVGDESIPPTLCLLFHLLLLSHCDVPPCHSVISLLPVWIISTWFKHLSFRYKLSISHTCDFEVFALTTS